MTAPAPGAALGWPGAHDVTPVSLERSADLGSAAGLMEVAMSMAMSSSERPGSRPQQLTRSHCLSVFMRPPGRAVTVAPPAPVIPVLVATRPSRHGGPAGAVRHPRCSTELDLSDVHGDGEAAAPAHGPWGEPTPGTPLLPPRTRVRIELGGARQWAGLATLGCPRPHLPGVGPSALELSPRRGPVEERTR